MKYYYPENLRRYAWVNGEEVRTDSNKWRDGDPKGAGYTDFSTRNFLEEVIPRLSFDNPQLPVLEYGCGTGAAACYLAERGFEVHAVDLIPAAIRTAKAVSEKRGLDIHFEVADVCELSDSGTQYNMIVDSFCLQHIVFDVERARLFSAVRSRLRTGGYYLVTSVILDQKHEEPISDEEAKDPRTGIVYNRYGSGLIDVNTGIVLRAFDPEDQELPDLCLIDGQTYLPYRRYLRPDALIKELEDAGFSLLMRDQSRPESFVFSLKCGSHGKRLHRLDQK